MIVETAAFAAARAEWTSALGSANVVWDRDRLGQASAATFDTHTKIPGILRPADRHEVQECLRIANRFRVPVYPISTGKNWGYGSRLPVTEAIQLDLGRLNRIIEVNESLAFATIEPGVTQRQLYDFLKSTGSRLWMDATGSSPDCSVIGNTLERGFGHTPMGDHCGSACGFEVVMPNGDCVETGFCRFSGSKTGAVGRWGLGPSLDGLFPQSNLGIVTRMSVWLMPAPEYFQAFFFQTDREDALSGIIDALRPLRLNGTLRSVVHVGNDYKVLSATTQYPWTETTGATPLNREEKERIRRKLQIGAWSGSGGLYGTRNQVCEARSLVRRALKGRVSRLQFVDDRALRLLTRFAKPYGLLTGRDLRPVLKFLPSIYNLLKGVPTDANMASTYWRKAIAVPGGADPDRDRCGLLWCSPSAPNTGRDAEEVVRLATAVLLTHGFEPMISLSLLSERMLVGIIAITYDRDVPGDDAKALACHRTLTELLAARGYPPYRLNVASMDLSESSRAYSDLVQSIKDAVDPNNILAPGRYEPRRADVQDDVKKTAEVDRADTLCHPAAEPL
jgi:4-cresol dehydrogenase (hydroxylating)